MSPEFVIWVLCNFNTGPGKKKISGKEATNFPERIPIKLAEWLMRSLFVVETVSLYLYPQLILLSLVSGESLQTSLHTFFSIDMTSYFCPENLDQCLWKLFPMSNASMFKEYKPSEKCYISDWLQMNKIIAAAPCGTERDINQQENDLYKTISAGQCWTAN